HKKQLQPTRPTGALPARSCFGRPLKTGGSMSEITKARKALVARILEGDGKASHAQRRAEFDNAGLAGPPATLVGKVARDACKVTDEDFAAARAAGLSEDQIFELVVCAAIGQATRQYDKALAALEAVTAEEGVSHAPRDPR